MLTEKKYSVFSRGKPLKYHFYMNDIFDKHHYFAFRCTENISFSQAEKQYFDLSYFDIPDDPLIYDSFSGNWI